MNTIRQIGNAEVYEYNKPEHTVTDTVIIYNYFCLKIDCFFTWFRRYYDHDMKCPKCGESKDVCCKE